MNSVYHQTKFMLSASKLSETPEDQGKEVAFAGRSNAGKSSAINTLTRQNSLARISKTPGRTQLLNFFEIDAERKIVDLPGYGYAKVSKTQRDSWRKMILTFFENRQQLRGVVCLVDIRHKADPKDILMRQMLQSINIPFLIAATKSDKIPKSKANAAIQKLKIGLNLGDQKIIACSSLKKRGIDNILNWITDRVIDFN